MNSVELRPRVSGHIDAVQFVEGAHVNRGQVLFRIDPRPFREEVRRLEAELRRVESQLALARVNHVRGEHLLNSGATAPGDFDKLVAAQAEAGAALDSTRASLASARLNLEFTNVRAPIEGRASYALITAGNLVSNANVLTRIVSDDPIYAYFDIGEAAFLRFHAGGAKGAAVQLGLSDEPEYPHHGKLDLVDNQVDTRTGTVRGRAVFENRDQRLLPGLFARVRLFANDRFRAFLIDDKALLTDQDRKYVYVVDDKGRAQRKDVTLGRSLDGLRIVQAGLDPGDRVIVEGVQKVFAAGMPVHAQEVAMRGAKDIKAGSSAAAH